MIFGVLPAAFSKSRIHSNGREAMLGRAIVKGTVPRRTRTDARSRA